MSPKASTDHETSRPKADKSVSQLVFVIVALGIILAGVWTLYMGDAPYHPDDAVSRGDFSLAGD